MSLAQFKLIFLSSSYSTFSPNNNVPLSIVLRTFSPVQFEDLEPLCININSTNFYLSHTFSPITITSPLPTGVSLMGPYVQITPLHSPPSPLTLTPYLTHLSFPHPHTSYPTSHPSPPLQHTSLATCTLPKLTPVAPHKVERDM